MSRDAKDTIMPPEVQWVIAGPYQAILHATVCLISIKGPMLERMSGEQIWDSLVTLAYPDVDNRKRRKPHAGYNNFVKYSTMTGDELFAEVMRRTGSRPKCTSSCTPCQRSTKDGA